jgi:hypothetical protein
MSGVNPGLDLWTILTAARVLVPACSCRAPPWRCSATVRACEARFAPMISAAPANDVDVVTC